MAVDTRHRDKSGETSQKHGNTFRIDFFEERARQCRAQAKRANNKADRESWLEMARRWEGMLRPHNDNRRGRDCYKQEPAAARDSLRAAPASPWKTKAGGTIRRIARANEWLWPSRVAIGKQTMIVGEPGLGKSQLTAFMAAAITTAGQWPCNEGQAPLGSVIILSAEDDAADTIRPRLDAAGADATRVLIVSAVRSDDGKGRRHVGRNPPRLG